MKSAGLKKNFLTSTGFDSLLSFNLETKRFDWGFQLRKEYDQWTGGLFDPRKSIGPRPVNDFHINMVDEMNGIFKRSKNRWTIAHRGR